MGAPFLHLSQKWEDDPSGGPKKQNPPGWCRVGRKTLSYPHAGAQVQQHGVAVFRMPIAYAVQKYPSNNTVPRTQDKSFTTESTESHRGKAQSEETT